MCQLSVKARLKASQLATLLDTKVRVTVASTLTTRRPYLVTLLEVFQELRVAPQQRGGIRCDLLIRSG